MKLKKILIVIMYILMAVIYIISIFTNVEIKDIDNVLPIIGNIKKLY